MSHNIVHVLRHGSTITKERGMLVCKSSHNTNKEQSFKHPVEDIRAIVIASRGIVLTSNVVSAVLSNEGVILHCDEKYTPCGITLPLARITDDTTYLNQAKRPNLLNNQIWKNILIQKTLNQKAVLEKRGATSLYLNRAIKNRKIDEGNCARRYWEMYFSVVDRPGMRRDRFENDPPNQMLNYGYAVLSSLCHRSLIIHGLSPLLGVCHVSRYRSTPLVYDIMEPYRPFVDDMLADFLDSNETLSMKNWAQKIGLGLTEKRVLCSGYSIRLINAVDKTSQSLARCYGNLTANPLWFPKITTD